MTRVRVTLVSTGFDMLAKESKSRKYWETPVSVHKLVAVSLAQQALKGLISLRESSPEQSCILIYMWLLPESEFLDPVNVIRAHSKF